MTIFEREREACRFLEGFPRDVGTVAVGGYAVNPWAPPRYCDDLDLVVPRYAEAEIERLVSRHLSRGDGGCRGRRRNQPGQGATPGTSRCRAWAPAASKGRATRPGTS